MIEKINEDCYKTLAHEKTLRGEERAYGVLGVEQALEYAACKEAVIILGMSMYRYIKHNA